MTTCDKHVSSFPADVYGHFPPFLLEEPHGTGQGAHFQGHGGRGLPSGGLGAARGEGDSHGPFAS